MEDDRPHEVTSVAPAPTGSAYGRLRRIAVRGALLIGIAVLLFSWLIYQESHPLQRVDSGVITAIAADHNSHTYALIDVGTSRNETGWQVGVSVQDGAFVLDAGRYVRMPDDDLGSQPCTGLVFVAVSLPFGWSQYPMVDHASGHPISVIETKNLIGSYAPDGCLPTRLQTH